MHVSWLTKIILPLHAPNTMRDELLPMLYTYHAPLVYCCTQYLASSDSIVVLLVDKLVTLCRTRMSSCWNR